MSSNARDGLLQASTLGTLPHAKALEVGLKVERLEEDQGLQERVLSVFHATMVTFAVTPCVKLVENHTGRGTFLQVEVKATPTKT